MSDVMSKTKEISSEINALSQQEQAIKERISNLKRLIEERKHRKASLEAAMKEEAELMKLLDGV